MNRTPDSLARLASLPRPLLSIAAGAFTALLILATLGAASHFSSGAEDGWSRPAEFKVEPYPTPATCRTLAGEGHGEATVRRCLVLLEGLPARIRASQAPEDCYRMLDAEPRPVPWAIDDLAAYCVQSVVHLHPEHLQPRTFGALAAGAASVAPPMVTLGAFGDLAPAFDVPVLPDLPYERAGACLLLPAAPHATHGGVVLERTATAQLVERVLLPDGSVRVVTTSFAIEPGCLYGPLQPDAQHAPQPLLGPFVFGG